MQGLLESYFRALTFADPGAAAAILGEALSRGESPRRLIIDVLVAGQRSVGQRWMEGTWSVADEHAATAVTEQSLTLIAPPRARRATATTVVMACAEGEWHSLPARLAAELARSPDLDIVVLGGSIPAGHLQRHLSAAKPRALALSTTMPTNLIAASRSIQAAHAEGVPVIVGGAAWGEGQHRARRLGADLRLDDAQDLPSVLGTLSGRDPMAGHQDIPAEALLLDAPPPEFLLLALERATAAISWMRTMTPYQRHETLVDLGWLARHAAASVACDDATIMRDLLTWLLVLLTPRGVPAAAVIDGCYYLAEVVENEAPGAAGVLRREADHAHESRRRNARA